MLRVWLVRVAECVVAAYRDDRDARLNGGNESGWMRRLRLRAHVAAQKWPPARAR